MTRAWDERFRRHTLNLSVTRYGKCRRCGGSVSDVTVTHGSFGGGKMCQAVPGGPWRYVATAHIGGMQVDTSSLPADIAAMLAELVADAKRERRTRWRDIEGQRARA